MILLLFGLLDSALEMLVLFTCHGIVSLRLLLFLFTQILLSLILTLLLVIRVGWSLLEIGLSQGLFGAVRSGLAQSVSLLAHEFLNSFDVVEEAAIGTLSIQVMHIVPKAIVTYLNIHGQILLAYEVQQSKVKVEEVVL